MIAPRIIKDNEQPTHDVIGYCEEIGGQNYYGKSRVEIIIELIKIDGERKGE